MTNPQTVTVLDVTASGTLAWAFSYTNSNPACTLTSILALTDLSNLSSEIAGITLSGTTSFVVNIPSQPGVYNFFLRI